MYTCSSIHHVVSMLMEMYLWYTLVVKKAHFDQHILLNTVNELTCIDFYLF